MTEVEGHTTACANARVYAGQTFTHNAVAVRHGDPEECWSKVPSASDMNGE